MQVVCKIAIEKSFIVYTSIWNWFVVVVNKWVFKDINRFKINLIKLSTLLNVKLRELKHAWKMFPVADYNVYRSLPFPLHFFKDCTTGFHGPNCGQTCRYPSYGQSKCSCEEQQCSHITGCRTLSNNFLELKLLQLHLFIFNKLAS